MKACPTTLYNTAALCAPPSYAANAHLLCPLPKPRTNKRSSLYKQSTISRMTLPSPLPAHLVLPPALFSETVVEETWRSTACVVMCYNLVPCHLPTGSAPGTASGCMTACTKTWPVQCDTAVCVSPHLVAPPALLREPVVEEVADVSASSTPGGGRHPA
jgi:hypothetical protein